MKKSIKTKKGFALLVSIVVTSMLVIVSFVVANIAFKQLILANSNQESQYAFYNADSGIECAVYWDFRNGTTAFDPSSPSPISCNGQTVTPTVLSAATTTFTVNLTKGCVTVQVGKHANGLTIIDSRGYNTCVAGAIRKLERGTKLTYENTGSALPTSIMGRDTIGTGFDSGNRNLINAIRFTMPNENGTLTSISVYIGPISSAPNNQFQVAIYSDSAGRPGNLINSSGSATLVGDSWNTIPIAANLVANTVYHLAFNTNASSDAQNNFSIASGASCQFSWVTQAFGTWPATLSSFNGCADLEGSIYGTYTIP